jgi:hypothetical protein
MSAPITTATPTRHHLRVKTPQATAALSNPRVGSALSVALSAPGFAPPLAPTGPALMGVA